MGSFPNSNSSIDIVINNGINYLLSQHKEGKWQGFPTLAGTSDVWVTGFVLAHISKLINQSSILKESQSFLLESRHPSDAWSYSTAVPPDADSTAWCLSALQSYDELNTIDLDTTRKFLWSQKKDQGIATYTTMSGIGQFISAPNDEAISGWTSVHPDVSIAAVLADLYNENASDIISWLKEEQLKNGLIDSYWWRVPYYTTTLLQRALSLRKEALDQTSATKLATLLYDHQLASGGFGLDATQEQDAFSTAMALESFTYLSNLDIEHRMNKCFKALVQSQQPNGSWEGNFILRIPAPFISDPSLVDTWSYVNGGGNSYVNDQNGIFATAMACYALDHYRRTISFQPKSSLTKSLPI